MPKLTRKAIELKLKNIHKAEVEYEKALNKLIKECNHPKDEIFELPYQERVYGGCAKPKRVCRKCGLAEEGWGVGYWKLREWDYDIPEISNELFDKYCLKFMEQQDIVEKRYGKRHATLT